MAEAYGATLEGAPAEQTEVLDSRAQDEAYQALLRSRTEEERLQARLERSAGVVPEGGDLTEALAMDDTLDEGDARSSLSERRSRTASARARMQQARQIAQLARGAQQAAARVRWLVVAAQAVGAVLANPVTWYIIALTPVAVVVIYCSQPSNAAQCTEAFTTIVVETIQKAFGTFGTEDADTDTTTTPAAAGSKPPGTTQTGPEAQPESATPSLFDADSGTFLSDPSP